MKYQISPRFAQVLDYSKVKAESLHNPLIEPEHLLLGLIHCEDGKALQLLRILNLDVQVLEQESEAALSSIATDYTPDTDISNSPKTEQIIFISILEARKMKAEEADTEHILLAIMKVEKNNTARVLLERHNIHYNDIINLLKQKKGQQDIQAGFGYADDEEEDDNLDNHDDINSSSSGSKSLDNLFSSTQVDDNNVQNDTPVIDKFGTDLTQAAAKGLLDPVVGREKEIERVSQILSRRKKNNPILIGSPGVGKSAIVEGLAMRIVNKQVSRILFNKRVISLNIASIVAGTKYRGQFEERMQSILNEVKDHPNIILFIDEIHTIIGAGSTPGSMDAANILKPALARGEIQCVGATTTDEYRKSIEKDGALERRFQKILVEPTSPDETLQILHNIKERYEIHHNVTYSDEALQACVNLSERYITDRAFPDKAIDVLDEAGARTHITHISVSKEIEQQEKYIAEVHALKCDAVVNQNFELAADYRDQESKLQNQLERMKAAWEKTIAQQRISIDQEDVAEVVSLISGVPVQRMGDDEHEKLKNLGNSLKGAVIGQDEAINKLVRTIQRARVGLKDPNKPIGAFMFIGPTGVGKTYLAKKLAEQMFSSADALIRIDMSEYMEKHTVSRMVGAPPGYVGYDEGGQLTEKVRRKPYSIILLDEIEKAHSDVFNILLQVLDDGRLTDNNGTTIDFKNTIIIMTSNCGTRQLKEFSQGIGFTQANDSVTNNKEYSRDIIMKALRKQFAPEFLNRLDDIIHFDQLSLENIEHIVDIELNPLMKRVEAMGYHLEVDEEAKKLLAKKGYDVQYGARPLHRAIQTLLEDAICELALQGDLKAGDKLVARYKKQDDKESIEVTKL